MSDESISVKVTDSVSPVISEKIERISKASRQAYTDVNKLQSEIAKLNGAGLANLAAQLNLIASASLKLAQAQQAANITAARAAILNNQLGASAAALAAAQQRQAAAAAAAAAAQTRVGEAAARAAAAQARAAAESQRLAAASQNAAAAQARAELAALRLAEAQRRLADQNNATSSSFGRFAGLLTAGTFVLATRSLLQYADAYTTLQNKLQTVATSQEQVNQITERLYDLSNETRTSVQSTATAFTRFDRALALMGKSQEETFRMTETINKALVVSGTTAGEASSALLQLSQAFNSGKLQGDEFRSLAENMPIVLDAVAKAMDKPVNQVKKLSTQGKITSEVLFKAFKIIEDQVDATFAKTTPTISQAMTVWANKFEQYVGKVDKATGVSATLSKTIILLANNLGLVTVAASVLSAGLLVAFGPKLLSLFTAATRAVIAFNAALLLNPIGLIAVGITAAVVAIIALGDKIKVTSDGMVNLQDVAGALIGFLKDGFYAVADVVTAAWDSIKNGTAGVASDVVAVFASMYNRMIANTKDRINQLIAFFVAGYNVIKTSWNNFGPIMEGVFAVVVNAAAVAVETVVNSWQLGLRGIAKLAEGVAPDMSKSLNGALDNLKFQLPRVEIKKESAAAGAELAKGVTDAFSKDYLGDAGDAIMARARDVSKARQEAEKLAQKDLLRGSGKNTIVPDEAKKKKQKLTQEEKDYNKALREVTAPQRELNAALKVANDLYTNGAIGIDRRNSLILKAKDAYEAATNPLYAFNKATQEELEVLNKIGPAMEAERNVIQARNEAIQKGLPFTEQMAQGIRDTTAALQMQQMVSDTRNKIYDETIGAQTSLTAQQTAYNEALAAGQISAEQYGIAVQRLNVDAANLKMQMGTASFDDALTAGMGKFVSNFTGVMQGLSTAWGDFFTGFVDGFANSIGRAIVYGENLQDTMSQVSKQILSDLIGTLIKLGVQYVVNQALGTSAMAAGTAASVAAGTATAAAWAPAAAAVSLASWGANAAPAVAGIASANVAAQSFAAIKIPGFEVGGYTGSAGKSEVAGFVHGQEFVMNADATKKNRPVLEAMNNGGSVAAVNTNSANSNGGGIVMVAFDIDNHIEVSGGSGDSSADSLEKAATAISQKTQSDIMDSIRMGGVWNKVIKAV